MNPVIPTPAPRSNAITGLAIETRQLDADTVTLADHKGPAGAIDPEEAFIAALSSCHMLWFLAIAGKRKLRIDRYHDQATGVLAKNADGKWCVSVVTLQPEAQFSGELLPTREQVEAMHHSAHAECYIANSVSTQVHIEPVHPPAA